MDDTARDQMWQQITARYAEEMPMIQLVQLTNTWAMRRGLRHEPRMDERTVAMGVRPEG